MKRKLFRQTVNEWRPNLWLAIELLIVSIIVWYIADFLYTACATRLQTTGFNTEHVYRMEFKRTGPSSPRYIAPAEGEDENEIAATELRRLLAAIRQRPEVVDASLSYQAEPYSQSYYGTSIWSEYDSLEVNVYRRAMTPNHPSVVGYESARADISIEQLQDLLREGKLLLTEFKPGFNGYGNSHANRATIGAEDLVGRSFHFWGDSINSYTIGGLLKPIKRTSIESGLPISVFIPIDESTTDILEGKTISVRVRPEADVDFIANFKADIERLYRSGNTYISNVKSYDTVRIESDHEGMVEIRKFIACMVFMLVSVFLGLLGTFWFRTQQRVSEIAVRKVNGASNVSVFRRLISEGLIILVAVTPLAVLGDWLLTHYELNADYYGYFEIGRFIATVAATFILLAIMIIGGIWFPANRAMKVDPARALADE